MASAPQILSGIASGDHKMLARALTIIENELEGWEEILLNIKTRADCKVVGITGPPGAGKSTLVNSLISQYNDKKIAVLAVDPSSPFNFGSLLGDRVRMSKHFLNRDIFIRSLASRNSLGGLSAKAIEMTDLLKAAPFDYIFIETVGVGQSEVEVAGLADVTVLVLVPESGDEVQMLKSGVMEIADIFVVNKADREGSDDFANKLGKMLYQTKTKVPVFKTNAENGEGIPGLAVQLSMPGPSGNNKFHLIAEKAYRLIARKRMQNVKKEKLVEEIALLSGQGEFNMYSFVNSKIMDS